jgi:hypothetical protein
MVQELIQHSTHMNYFIVCSFCEGCINFVEKEDTRCEFPRQAEGFFDHLPIFSPELVASLLPETSILF